MDAEEEAEGSVRGAVRIGVNGIVLTRRRRQWRVERIAALRSARNVSGYLIFRGAANGSSRTDVDGGNARSDRCHNEKARQYDKAMAKGITRISKEFAEKQGAALKRQQ